MEKILAPDPDDESGTSALDVGLAMPRLLLARTYQKQNIYFLKSGEKGGRNLFNIFFPFSNFRSCW